MIDWRAFIGSLALGTLAMPRAAPAQRARKFARIGPVFSSCRRSDADGRSVKRFAVRLLSEARP